MSRGEVVSRLPIGTWQIDSAREVSRTDKHVEEHIVWLLDLLEPVAPVLRRLSDEQDLAADFGCGYFTSRWNSSFGFSSGTLERIARLGASLSFDMYVNDLEPGLRRAVGEVQSRPARSRRLNQAPKAT
jgi:hypothetical protein